MQRWKSEYIKYAGQDLLNSIKSLMNEIARGNIPKECKEVKIKSINKNKGNRDEAKYQRGIYITSTLTKLFEKIIRNRNKEKLTESITKY